MMDAQQLNVLFEQHSLWLSGDGGTRADLRGADLRGANLRYADLTGANLQHADLPATKAGQVCRMDFGGWSICVRHDVTFIGCRSATNQEWLSFTPADVKGFDDEAEQWWEVHGDVIKSAIRCVMKKAEGLPEQLEEQGE